VTLFSDLLVVEGVREQPQFFKEGMSACHQLGSSTAISAPRSTSRSTWTTTRYGGIQERPAQNRPAKIG